MADTAKRLVDVVASSLGILLASPVLLPVLLIVWRQDGHSPLYVASRVGKGHRPFRMVKLRSMVAGADAAGWDSTKADDPRITSIGHIIRRYKLDELPQLWNVLKGDMSLVGPRPNVSRETTLYTPFVTVTLTADSPHFEIAQTRNSSSWFPADFSERGSSSGDLSPTPPARARAPMAQTMRFSSRMSSFGSATGPHCCYLSA